MLFWERFRLVKTPCRFCPPTTARSSLDEHAAWHGMICRACAEGRHASAPSKCHDDVSVPGSRCSPRRVHVPAHTPRNCADTQRVSRVGEARPTCMRDMAARACAHAEHASMRVETIAAMRPAGAAARDLSTLHRKRPSVSARHVMALAVSSRGPLLSRKRPSRGFDPLLRDRRRPVGLGRRFHRTRGASGVAQQGAATSPTRCICSHGVAQKGATASRSHHIRPVAAR